MVVGEKFVFCEAYEEVGVARSHFGSHCNTVDLFVVVVNKRKTVECNSSFTMQLHRRRTNSELTELGLPAVYLKEDDSECMTAISQWKFRSIFFFSLAFFIVRSAG